MDAVKMFIEVRDNRIEVVSDLVYGCCAAIATSSMTTILVKGKTLDEALVITENDIVEALCGLPENMVHCSNLGISVFRKVISKYIESHDEEVKL